MKRWKYTATDNEAVQELSQELDIPSVFCELFVQRSIVDKTAAEAFFQPSLDALHDPFLMKGMQAAVERIDQALTNNEHILIYGDYDVDGTTSVALVYRFLSRHHYRLDYYVPDRFGEGYGLSEEGIAYAERQGYSLIICLDCGTRDLKEIDLAKAAGIDMIICDHHTPGETLPDVVALLNPKQEDCAYPFKELSACGVGFKLVQGYTRFKQLQEEHLHSLLDLVVVSIACDYVKMTGENRILAHHGLKCFNQNPCIGFSVLRNRLERQPIYSIQDIVFAIGPVINAAGRMGHAKNAVRLLLAADKYSAHVAAKVLLELNVRRKKREHQMLEEAKEQVSSKQLQHKSSIVIEHEYWHKGIVGIIASRVVEAYNRTGVVLAKVEDNWVGSIRSAQKVNVVTALDHCADILETYGGHPFAAGLTVNQDKLEEFKERFEEQITLQLNGASLDSEQCVDAKVAIEAITPQFIKTLGTFAPFGPDNMRPVFYAVIDVKEQLRTVHIMKQAHLKLIFDQLQGLSIEAVGFGMGAHATKILEAEKIKICFIITKNNYRGRSRLQLHLKDIQYSI